MIDFDHFSTINRCENVSHLSDQRDMRFKSIVFREIAREPQIKVVVEENFHR